MKKLIGPIIAMALAFAAGIALSEVLASLREEAVLKRFNESEMAILRQLQDKLHRVDVQSREFITACTLAKRSVVGITVVTTNRPRMGPDFRRSRYRLPRMMSRNREYASGVIIDKAGYIVTNEHVVKSARGRGITVTLEDKRRLRAKVIGTDPLSDIAIIKVNAKDLPYATLGDSDDIEVGQLVMAIGNPFGLSHSVSMGLVSALGRQNVGVTTYQDYVQTDAAINPGNSGGALINLKGEVIGISSSIASRTGRHQGVGFAIPINMVTKIKDILIKEGSVPRGWLGITMQDVTPPLAKYFGLKDTSKGVLVTSVYPDSPAREAGIQVEDILLTYGGKPLENRDKLLILVGQSKIGEKVDVGLFSKGKNVNVQVKIGDFSKAMAAKVTSKGFGVKVAELTESEIRQYRYQGKKGIIVTEVTEDSPADEAGVRVGMLIQKINRHFIRSMDDYDRIRKEVEKAKALYLLVRFSRNAPQYLTLRR